MSPRAKRNTQIAIGVGLLSLLVVGIASAGGKKTGECGDAMIANPAIAELAAKLGKAKTEAERALLVAALAEARANPCVPATCPDGHHRSLSGLCVKNTPEDPDPGFDPYDPGTDKCPDGQRWSIHDRKCIPICGPDQFYNSHKGECQDKPSGGDIDDILKPVPVPGNFYQVKHGDEFFGKHVSDGSKPLSICYMALRRAAYEAARQIGGLDDAAAWAHVQGHASTLAHEIHALRPYLSELGCGWWNDETNASWRYKQGKATPNPLTGRAISLNPVSAPNVERLRGGEPPARNVRLGTPDQKGKGAPTIADGSWRSYPLLWIPEIDLQVFWSSGYNTITSDGLTWPDGSSRRDPPPWVQSRGIFDATGTLAQGTVMGCPPSQKAVT